MATIVIFNTETEEVVHAQGDNKHALTPDEMSASWFEYTGTVRDGYTSLIIEEDLTFATFMEKKAVLNGEVIDRMPMPITLDTANITADGIDKSTFTNCPEFAEVFFDGESVGFVGVDGIVEVTMDVPRVINVTLEMFPYLKYEAQIYGS